MGLIESLRARFGKIFPRQGNGKIKQEPAAETAKPPESAMIKTAPLHAAAIAPKRKKRAPPHRKAMAKIHKKKKITKKKGLDVKAHSHKIAASGDKKKRGKKRHQKKIKKSEVKTPDKKTHRRPRAKQVKSFRSAGKAQNIVSAQKHKEQAAQMKEKFSSADSQRVNRFIEQKAAGKIDEAKLSELEDKIDALMEKYSIPEKEVERTIDGTDISRVLDSVSKLASLAELEKRTNAHAQPEQIRTAIKVTETVKPVQQEIVGIATEIKMHRIVTDFDKVISYIAEKGRAPYVQIAKDLGIPLIKVDECCAILREEKLIEVVYPPFGDPLAQTLDYKEKMELEKLKKKNALMDKQKNVK